MVKALGIDPGTGSMDILAFDDETGRIIIDKSIPRPEVTRDPSIILRLVEVVHGREGLDAIVAPSGYGIPLKRVQEATREEIYHATFVNCRDARSSLQINGLRRLMLMLRDSNLPAWFTPGVVQLPTVPRYRKANRIDLGTADKVYSVAASMAAEAEAGARPGDISIVVVEAGMAYTSAILVEAGQIVDAVAGTAGFWGFLGAGYMDAELAYALASAAPGFSKRLLFEGGVASIYGIRSPEEMEDLASRGDERGLGAVKMLAEGAAKAVLALMASATTRPARIYLSGRLARLPITGASIRAAIERATGISSIRQPLRLGVNTKEGATGAALIANGIAGGKYSWIIDQLKLKESNGTIFDNITLGGLAGELRRFFARECPGG